MPDTTKLAATKIRETGGPTTLIVGAIADGEVPIRAAATLVGTRIVSAEAFVSPQFNQLPAQDPNPLIRWNDLQAFLAMRVAARPEEDPHNRVRWDDAQHVLSSRIFGG